MEIEQLEKRIEWLDGEQRKDKNRIGELEDKIRSLEGKLDAVLKKDVELDGEVTRLRMTLARVDDFDEALANLRIESGRNQKELEKQTRNQIEDAKALLSSRIEGVNTSVEQLRTGFDPIPELEKQMSARIDEEIRLNNSVSELKKKIDDIDRVTEEQLRQYRLIEENRQRDNKRLTDLQGEVSAARKRLDEQRGRMDLIEVDAKKSGVRLDELNAQRRELIQEQSDFLERENLMSAKRENTWRAWQTRFAAVEAQAAEIRTELQTLDATHRAVKHMQSDASDLAEQVERRVNEVIEIQRLADERFRQEWTTFKADDQKRWMNYTLSQKEQQDETIRQSKGLGERITILEDSLQEIEDQIRMVSTQTGNQLQTLLTMTRDWVSEYDQVLDSIR